MKKIFTIFCVMMVLTACGVTSSKEIKSDSKNEHDYQFTGESKHWEAVYSYNGSEIGGEKDKQKTYSSKDNYVLSLEYKGSLKELSSMKDIEYTYETATESGSKKEKYTEPPNDKKFTISGGSENGALVGAGEVIKVNVKWDGKEESFELHNKDK
ncbi:hypothetical protein [Peribacillus simplex]|uniref:hypothetical protein n=1 Tax=Peribacillus simplex TaxID=1478 RepID=UPI003D2E677C